MKFIKILIPIIATIMSISFTLIFILICIGKISSEDFPGIIICISALLGLSLALLTIIFCSNETDKAKILTKAYDSVISKVCKEEFSQIQNQHNQSVTQQTTQKSNKNIKMKVLRDIFKSYANAMADI